MGNRLLKPRHGTHDMEEIWNYKNFNMENSLQACSLIIIGVSVRFIWVQERQKCTSRCNSICMEHIYFQFSAKNVTPALVHPRQQVETTLDVYSYFN